MILQEQNSLYFINCSRFQIVHYNILIISLSIFLSVSVRLSYNMNLTKIDNILGLRSTYTKGFKIVHLNCRSILSKIDEMRYQYSGIDILVCSETWLDDRIMDSMIDIPGMDIFRLDRQNGYVNGVSNSRGAGVACYVNKELQLDVHIVSDTTMTTKNIEI